MLTVDVHNVSFKSHGLTCAGNLYLPQGHSKPLPCIVFANGFSGTKDWILPAFAERFAQQGLAAFTFDYRYLGESEGEPRQLIDLESQRADLRQALQLVRSDSRIDGSRIALWGTSLGGSHAVEVASVDNSIAAVVCNMPALDSVKGSNFKAKAKAANATFAVIVSTTLRLMMWGLADRIKGLLGLSPYYIKVYGAPGESIFTDPNLVDRFKKLGNSGSRWQNKVAARVLFNLPRYKYGTIERIKAPIFVALAANDIELNNNYVREKFAGSGAEIREYQYDHFSMYHDQAFEDVVKDQIIFLKKHLLR